MKNLSIRIRETENRSKNRTLSNGDHKNVTPEKDDDSGSQTIAQNGAQQSSTYNGDQCVPVKPQSCNAYSDQSSPTVFDRSSRMNTDSDVSECAKNRISKQRQESNGVEEKSEEKENWDCKEDEDETNTKRQPEAKPNKEFTWDNGEGKKAKDQNEESELERKFRRWTEGMLAGQRNEPQEKQSGDTERVKNDIDLIPAFRSYGWPKVAREWIQRERKWPSPSIVRKVLNEGYHLVAKSAKKNGNPDSDFRISFSHAEYLLSQEMNDIQRDCYVCLKKNHRAYLCTQPKSLVSFHLKNILLQTIEETCAEMWTDRNRAECMMVLLRKLLTALTMKDLRHFFVRSYNLFGVDYIEHPQSLEFLATKVEEILENLMGFSKQLIQNREKTKEDTKKECAPQKTFLDSEQSTSSKPATVPSNGTLEESPPRGSYATQVKNENEALSLMPERATQESYSAGGYRYHDLRDVDKVVVMDPLEMPLVEDFTLLVTKYNIPVGVFPGLFNALWHKRAYYWIWISTEPDIRRRVLVAIQGGLELLKLHLKQDDFLEGTNFKTFQAFFDRIFDPAVENPSHLGHLLPSGNFLQLMYKIANSFRNSSVKELREMRDKYFDLDTHPDASEFFDLFLELWFGDRVSNKSDLELRLLGKVESLAKSAMVHPTNEDKDQHGENNDAFESLFQRLVDACSSSIAREIRQNEPKNADDIPVD